MLNLIWNLWKRHSGRQCRRRTAVQCEPLEARQLLSAGNTNCPSTMRIGTNPEAVYDWSPAWFLTDVFNHSRDWIPHELNTTTGEFVWEGNSTVHIDEHGWPTELEQWTNADNENIQQILGTLMYRDTRGNYPAGVYRAEWDGVGSIASGAVSFDWDAVVIAHGTTPTGRNFADLQVTPTNDGIYMSINAIADSNQPVQNINVWMPDYQGQSFVGQTNWTPDAAFSPFHPLFVEQLQDFDTLRFMGMSAVLETDVTDWEDRRLLTDARQIVTDRVADGVAPEYTIALANETGTNAWINVPHTADEVYIENLAIMVRDTFRDDRTVYVEWSNEAWNPDYAVYDWVTDRIDADNDRWDVMAAQIRRNFDIWSEVFQAPEDQGRLVRVVGAFNHTPQVAQELLQRMGGQFDAVASATYVSPDTEERALMVPGVTTPAEILQSTLESAATTLGFLNEHRLLLESYEQSLGRDLEFVLYESGPHLDVDDTPAPEEFAQAFLDPEIYDIEALLLNGTFDLGVDLHMDFQFTERWTSGVGIEATYGGNFGSLQAQDQPLAEAHKYRALLEALDGSLIDQANQRPVISTIADYVVAPGDVLHIPFAVSDAETPPDSLVLITDSSESDLVPNSAITVMGSGTNRTLVVAPQASSAVPRALVTILVVDSDGGTTLESFYLDVQVPVPNTPPIATGASLITPEDTPLWIDLTAIASDAETPFDQLVFSFDNVAGGTVTQFDAWSAVFTPAPDFSGSAGFSFLVTDGGVPSLSSTATVDISVTPVNDAPVAGQLNLTTNEDQPVAFSLAGIISDPESPDAELLSVFPSVWGGTLQPTGVLHEYEFTPESQQSGTVQLWYRVSDPEGLESWGSVTIDVLPVNDIPTVSSLTLTTPEDTPVWIPLWQLVDDVETPFDQLVMTFSGVVGGTVDRIDTWNAVFTPLADFNGTAGFNLIVTDDGSPAQSGSAPIVINVNAVNDSPVAGDLNIMTDEDTPVDFDLSGIISDIETATSNLTVTFLSVWGGVLESMSGVHDYRFSPDLNEFGTVQLWYQVHDPEGLEDSGVVTIDVLPVNDAPVAQNAAFATAPGASVWIDLTVLVSDVETPFDQLLFSFTNLVGGTVTQIDAWSAVFTPLSGFTGTAGFDYSVTDTGTPGLTASASVLIDIDDQLQMP